MYCQLRHLSHILKDTSNLIVKRLAFIYYWQLTTVVGERKFILPQKQCQ